MDIGSRYSVETLGFVKPVNWQQFEKVRKEDFYYLLILQWIAFLEYYRYPLQVDILVKLILLHTVYLMEQPSKQRMTSMFA